MALSHGLTRVFIAAITISSIAAVLFGLSEPGPLPFLWNAVMGAADIFSVVCAITVLQVATPGRLLGRVFGAYESSLILSMACGSLVVGPLIDSVGPRLGTVIFAGAALAALLCCLPWLLNLERVLGLRLFLHRVPILSALSGGALEDLSGRLSLERFPPGTAIVREGEEGDSLYLIKQGKVEISQRGTEAEEQVLCERGPGDYFGEIALLRAVPRTATVRTVGAVELYRLSRSNYLDLVEHSSELSDALEQRLELYTSPWTRAVLRR
jgi:hypothetical protein